MTTVEQAIYQFREDRPVMNEFNHRPLMLEANLVKESVEVMEAAMYGQADKMAGELADVYIFLIELANKYGVDLETAVFDKLRANETRFPAEFFVLGEFSGSYWKCKKTNGERM